MSRSKQRRSRASNLLARAHALHQQHKYAQAARLYEKLLQSEPRHPDGLNLLGLVRYQQGRLEEARQLLERAINAKPDFKQAWLNYGNLRQQLRDLEGAIQAFEQVLRIDPASSFALLNIGNCLRVLGRYDEADAFYLRALASDPTFSLAWANLGKLARTKGEWERAMKTADAALDCPDPAPLGLCLWIEVHHLTKPSSELAQRAQELLAHPGSPGELLAEGQFFAHHIYGLDPQVLLQARDRVQQQIEATVEPGVSDHCPPPRAEPRTLGFISSAFRQHPVAFMALGALEHLKQQGFRVNIYSGRNYDDAYAQRFRACADEWRDISQMPDVEVVELMRADGVDVLFDLSGVTNHGRPRIPAMRAAPLQIKWVGGQSGPSGIPNMDAFLTDAVQSPPEADADHHERLLRMPNGYVTYTPPIDAPEPAAAPPVQRNGFITFGSLNKLGKLGPELLQVWAQILRAVPNSRLLLRAEGANEQVIQDAVAKVFEANGISRERLSFEGPAGHREFLDTYSRIDIALDSFPYTGGLTTCEALWMGVPVVALAGRFFCERHAATHLHNVGLAEFVAASPEEYAAKAIALAQDHEQIAHFRSSLRDKVKQSPLCDYQSFTADLAKLVREEWDRHVVDEAAVGGQEQVPSLGSNDPLHEEGASELTNAEQASVATDATPLSPADIAEKVEQACELAERLLIDQQPQKALELCQSVSRLDPKNPKVLFLLGMAQAMGGDAKVAVKPILEALNLEPSNEAWWRHAADVFAAAGSSENAEFALDRAAAIPVARLAGQLKDAEPDKLASTIDECEAALRDNPSDVVAFFMLTHALLARENSTSQQPALESALQEVGWLGKLPLYAYWFDYIERANHIETPRISVIVISNEPEENTPETMRCLREQVGDQGEVIFVNNGCNDEVFDCIRPYADTYIRLKANSGAYCARNIGAAFGRANILLFVEDDGVPEEDFIAAHLQIHEDYDVIAVRGVYQPSAGSGAPPHYRLGDEPVAAPCTLEGNASYQAQVFYKAGGWADWILFGHGGVELASRLLKLIPVPEKQIYHPDPVLRHDYFLSEEHLRNKRQRQNVSWHLISAYRPSWNVEFWRWEPAHRGQLKKCDPGMLTAWSGDGHKLKEVHREEQNNAANPAHSIVEPKRRKRSSAKVCVGVPMYNEAEYVAEVIRSLKDQSYENVEFFLSDNCSTDDTYEVCQRIIGDDRRFRLVRQQENLGAYRNFQLLFEQSQSEYFVWIGAHDVVSDNLIGDMVAVLDSQPDVAMASGMPMAIMPDGEINGPVGSAIYDFNHDVPLVRYIASVAHLSNCTCLHSMFRRSALDGFEMRATISLDKVVISRLLWSGKLKYIPDAFYYRRYFASRSSTQDERITGSVGALSRYDFVKYYLDDFSELYDGDERVRCALYSKIIDLLERRYSLACLWPGEAFRDE